MQQAVRGLRQGAIEVLQIAVVADINRRSRMQQVGEQNVAIEYLGVLQRGQGGIGERSGVLPDDPQREFFGELVVPLGTDDVVVKDVQIRVVVEQASQQIGVFNREPLQGTDGRTQRDAHEIRQHGRPNTRNKVRGRSQVHFAIDFQPFEVLRTKIRAIEGVGIIAVLRQSREI